MWTNINIAELKANKEQGRFSDLNIWKKNSSDYKIFKYWEERFLRLSNSLT